MARFWKYSKSLSKYGVLLVIGGAVYYGVELLWRGWSHWSMAAVGGICFVAIGLLNQRYTWDMRLTSQMFISGVIVTAVEFMAGLILNIGLGLAIWDYSDMALNLVGQICMAYFGLWQLLSVAAILLDDCVRWLLFGEEKPRYRLI